MGCDESRSRIFMSACPEWPLGRSGHVLPSASLPWTSGFCNSFHEMLETSVEIEVRKRAVLAAEKHSLGWKMFTI